MKLFQIKFEYNIIEDRLLLLFFEKESDSSCVEYRFWLTRRFASIFSQALDRLIGEELAGNVRISPDAVEAMKKFQHEAAVSKADFSTSYSADGDECRVFGDSGLLIVTLKIKKKAEGQYILSLLDQENKGIHLTTDMDLVHTLQKLLLDSIESAAWDLPLSQQNGEGADNSTPQGYIS